MKELNINNVTKSWVNVTHVYRVTWQNLSFVSEGEKKTNILQNLSTGKDVQKIYIHVT